MNEGCWPGRAGHVAIRLAGGKGHKLLSGLQLVWSEEVGKSIKV